MTNEERDRMKARLESGISMLLDKAEKVGSEKQKWNIDELGKMADIQKDITKAFKCLVKVDVMMSEHSVEQF